LDDDALMAALMAALPHLPNAATIPTPLTAENERRLTLALPGLKDRAKSLVELVDAAGFLFAARPLALDDKAAAALSTEARAILAGLLPALEAVGPWEGEVLETAVRTFAEAGDLKLGRIAQPLRAALTGRAVSPGIFDVLVALGRTESLARIADAAG
jgi:glutamyl-tRNA synthetase